MNFIKLPSGCLLNPFYVRTAYPRDNGIRIVLNDSTHADELMSIEDFQNLLREPAVTPIVSFTVDLDKLKKGETCSFTYEGTVKHGIISGFGYSNGAPYVKMIHDGDYYTKFLNTGEVI
jgi:hypothetical protein